MRFVLAVISIVLFASCDSNRVESAETTADDTALPVVVTDTTAEDAYKHIYAWQGNVDGKYPVLMWFRRHEDVVMGSLFYTAYKGGEIKLFGTVEGNDCKMLEMSPSGNISGVWYLSLGESGAEGRWYSPEKRKLYNASLMYTDTAVHIAPVDSIGKDVSGIYFYYYGAEGGQGYMEVVQKGTDVKIGFENVTGAPAHNIASLDGVTLPLFNNEAVYTSNEYGECSFRIRFFNGFAVVNYVDGKNDCGFGHNATVDGVYVRTK